MAYWWLVLSRAYAEALAVSGLWTTIKALGLACIVALVAGLLFGQFGKDEAKSRLFDAAITAGVIAAIFFPIAFAYKLFDVPGKMHTEAVAQLSAKQAELDELRTKSETEIASLRRRLDDNRPFVETAIIRLESGKYLQFSDDNKRVEFEIDLHNLGKQPAWELDLVGLRIAAHDGEREIELPNKTSPFLQDWALGIGGKYTIHMNVMNVRSDDFPYDLFELLKAGKASLVVEIATRYRGSDRSREPFSARSKYRIWEERSMIVEKNSS